MAEQGCLLSSCAVTRAEGSNPSLSATARWLRGWGVLAAGLLFAVATPVVGQPTGGMGGVVVDATGGVLPGARVTLVLADRGVERTQSAGPSGRFGFAGLRPGRYRITADHPGFQSSPPTEVVVEAGTVAEVELRLAVAGIVERVSAVSRRPLEVRGAGVRETVDRPVLEDLPNSRDVWSVLEQTPGILMNKINVGGAESGQQSLFSAAGSAWTQNRYTLNGVNVTDPGAVGASLAYYTFDSFEEVEVSIAGHRAEVPTPGVFLNIVTRKGGNDFAGSGAFFWEHERFQSENLDDALRARGVGQANRLKRLLDGSADLGGPVVRDRAWFYLSASRFRVEPYLPGFFLESGDPGVDLTQLDNLLGRASVEVAEGHEIGLFFYRNRKYRPFRSASLFRSRPETTFHQDSAVTLGQASWTAVLDESLLLEARASLVDLYFPYGAQPGREPDFSRWELNTGVWYGGSGRNTIYERDRWQGNVAATWFRDGVFGATHEFKAGLEVVHTPTRTTDDLYGGILYIHDRLEPIEVRISNEPVASRNFTRNLGFYVQDRVVRGRLALDLGLRADVWRAGYPDQVNEPGPWSAVFEGFGAAGAISGRDDLVSWFGVAPRLGASFDLTGDGRFVARFSAGRYLHQLGVSVPRYANPNALARALFRIEDSNFNRVADPGEVDFSRPLSVFLPARNEVDPDLAQPVTDELTLGIERLLPWDITLGLTGIWRRERNLIEDVDIGVPESAWTPVHHLDPGRDFVRGSADDVPITLWLQDPSTLGQSRFLLTNPGIGASFRGLIADVRKRYAAGWQLLASVTWSRSIGWLPGPGDQVDEGAGFGGPLLNNPNHGELHEGPTYWDRPFLARVSASTRLWWGLSAAASFRAHSGWPNYRTVIFTRTLDGQRLPQGSTEVVVEPPGAARSPAVPLLDLRLDHRFGLPGGVELATYLDVFNALNLNHVIGEGSRDDSFGAVVGILPPRVARLGIRVRF